MHFTAYQLTLKSDIALPELLPASENTCIVDADVRIRITEVNPGMMASCQQLGPRLWGGADDMLLDVPRVARFLIRNGNSIDIDAVPGIDEDSIRVFLLGSVMGALLYQRGYLVLHGNAIRIGNQCVICVGHSGAGKSTLAAGFMQRGYEVLADDVVPVDTHCRVVPGVPRIKLWKDVADRLQIDTSKLLRTRPHLEKFSYPLPANPETPPLPIRWVYILNNNYQVDTAPRPIQGLHRFKPLHDNTYRPYFLDGMSLKASHLQLCGKLANQIHLAQVSCSREEFALDKFIDRLLCDIAENP